MENIITHKDIIWTRLLKKMQRDGDCYISTRAGSPYKTICLDKKYYQVHRVAYWLHYGVDPGDSFVCHKCDTPACFNPNHLFLGTANDNILDAINKGRRPGNHRGSVVEVDGKLSYVKPVISPRVKSPPPPKKGMPSGTKNHNSKLTEANVREMRKLHADGNTIRSLAKQYNIVSSVASRIINGHMWKHIK